ncbi:MAG: hypothetical protein Q9213_003162 [Squamulea squamosa]
MQAHDHFEDFTNAGFEVATRPTSIQIVLGVQLFTSSLIVRMDLFSVTNAFSAFYAFLVYCVLLAVYRLYISPLAKFPGPKLAALTLWYEFYFDVVKKGLYIPYELHINDPEYYDELYVGSTRRSEKYPWTTKQFGPSTSVFATNTHELHRIRRAALASFFSTQSVQRLEPSVQSVVDKLTSRLRELQGSGKVVNVLHMYCALTLDIISEYSFGKAYGAMQREDFAKNWYQLITDASEMSHAYKQFGWLAPTLRALPVWLVKKMNPQLTALYDFQDMLREQVLGVKKDLADGKRPTSQTEKNVFHDMITNPAVRPEEKTTDHLVVEAVTVISAGMNTTAFCLAIITYHLVQNPKTLERLQGELAGIARVNDGKPSWQTIEKLPYLRAVVSEGLRLGNGVSHRLARISPDVDLQYKNWTIPKGVPVGMTSLLLHADPNVFPNPKAFKPERWLQDNRGEVRLEKYLTTFSKGTRQCLGMNLAYCELYLTLFAVFCPRDGGGKGFEFELFETSEKDVVIARDIFNAVPDLGSKGIRVVVK